MLQLGIRWMDHLFGDAFFVIGCFPDYFCVPVAV